MSLRFDPLVGWWCMTLVVVIYVFFSITNHGLWKEVMRPKTAQDFINLGFVCANVLAIVLGSIATFGRDT